MKASERAQELRAAIVEKLESHCAALEINQYWRIKNSIVQRGKEVPTKYIHYDGPNYYMEWEDIPFLSTYLCQAYRQQREADEQGIPF